MMKGIMLDDSGDLLIQQGLTLGDTTIQCAAIVLGMNQGEWKEDPALGPNLLRYIRSSANRAKIEKQIRLHLERAGVDYDELEENIQLILSENEN